ncbi:MAG TPA: bifunctional DNA primase/polymerase [Gaiellaceae bacterium]|nr:bifunctional DNA primase/polymerase [Gaiellaceae bacterium]
MVAVAQPADVVARRVELAMQMIDLGAALFPLTPNTKIPLIGRKAGGHGFRDASTDAAAARTFLTNAGHPNYGVVFPEGSDVVVLDLDGGSDARSGWQADWQRLYDDLGPPGLTYIVRTPSGGRHAYYRWRTDLYGAMPDGDEMLGWTVRKPWKGYVVGPGSTVNGQTYEPVGLPSIADLPEAWVRAAQRERKATPESPTITIKGPQLIKTGARHAYLRDQARYLRGVGLSGEALFSAVMELNRQLPEPKSEDDVRRAIGDVEERFQPDEIDPETGHRVMPTGGRAVGTRNSGPAKVLELPFYSARTIAEMVQEDVDWAWRDYLAFGTITELVGPPKAGKTTLVFAMLRALASGDPFLDRPTAKSPVVVLSEQGPTSLRAVIARSGLTLADDVHFLMHRDARTSDWQDVVETAIQQCRAVGSRVLVIDTLPVFAGLSGEMENNAGDALEAMQPLLGAAGEGLAVLINRHRRKGGASDIADEARGSGAFSGTVDVILSLRRKEGGSKPTVRVLVAASRFDETPEELYIELDDGQYVVLGDNAALEAEETRRLLLEVLSAQSDVALGTTTDELISATGKARTTIQRVLSDLYRTGHVEKHGKRPVRYALAGSGMESAQTLTPYGGEASERSGHMPYPGGTASIFCVAYSEHQSQHVQRSGKWICTVCSEGVA